MPFNKCERNSRSILKALTWLAVVLGSGAPGGCAALTNPVAVGIPVSHMPPELKGESREGRTTIPLNLLRQPPPDDYLLAAGDVLGVWIEGVLGERGQSPPTHFSEKGDQPPALGYPIPVRKDGKLPLPLVGGVQVKGLTVEQAEEAIRRRYTEPKQLLVEGARVIVTLIRPRQYHILVIRQDSSGGGTSVSVNNFGVGGASELIGATKRGTGHVVDLPAYENDVLTALAKTGGLPGLDAMEEVVIQRGYFKSVGERAKALQELETLPPTCKGQKNGQFVRIPLRVRPGEQPPFNAEDVILQTGDIVFIEERDPELFFTGGLLPPGEHLLPRDRDLNVVEAISRVRGPIVNGGIAGSNLSGTIVGSGLGGPSPSLLTVLRKTPGYGQVAIRVDLNRALRDPNERIIIQPGDFLILQETPTEAFARYMSDVFKFNLVYKVIDDSRAQATANVTVP